MLLTSQTPNHVEMTKIASVKVELLTASACLKYMLCPRQIKLRVTKYGFRHVYKLTTYLVSLAESLPLQ